MKDAQLDSNPDYEYDPNITLSELEKRYIIKAVKHSTVNVWKDL